MLVFIILRKNNKSYLQHILAKKIDTCVHKNIQKNRSV